MTILCATRGGEASIEAQEGAIALAKERQTDIAFLYVADVQFLYRTTHASAAIMDTMETEMEHMGEFLLLMAKERAEKVGVSASIIIKNGVFREALMAAAREVEAEMVVLGTPDEANITQRELLDDIASAVKDQLGIETRILGD